MVAACQEAASAVEARSAKREAQMVAAKGRLVALAV